VPEILNEIWEVMGESGKAVRKSLLWIIETVSFLCVASIHDKLKYFIHI
jgi:hypothetical protein